ncbi:MAG: hypothetical protein R2843_13905 [Thermomicrobiales bacterium]
MAEYIAFEAALAEAGIRQESEQLDDPALQIAAGPAMATTCSVTVRSSSRRNSQRYYIIDVANLDEAIRWATRLPDARTGSVEICDHRSFRFGLI